MNTFTKKVLTFYKKHGRHGLPWRKTNNPYHILVSEIMLQQTQVERVIPKYKSFLKRFPTCATLAKASLGDVIREWQGLGYNRRAKFLHQSAKIVVAHYKGRIPSDRKSLEALSGIGHYTAGAIRVFAFDEPDDFLETNIRTALTYHFFSKRRVVSDQELLSALPRVRGRASPRLFYSAMMDYGAHLKAKGIRINHKKKGYVKQKPFKGSLRQVRGAIVRSLIKNHSLLSLNYPEKQVSEAIEQLIKERLIIKKGMKIVIPH